MLNKSGSLTNACYRIFNKYKQHEIEHAANWLEKMDFFPKPYVQSIDCCLCV